jgi:hypothetical protein
MQHPRVVMFPAQIYHHRGPRPESRLSLTYLVGSIPCALPHRQHVAALVKQCYFFHRKLDSVYLLQSTFKC